MAQTKRRLEFFALYDVDGMARHYEKMAAKGWVLEKAGGVFPRYRKTEPQNLKFTVVYLNKASDYALPTDEQDEFYDMCRQRGWYLVTKTGEMHVFANNSENPVPIETDGAVQMENLHRSKGRTFRLSNAFLAFLQLTNIYSGIKRFYRFPSTFFTAGVYTTILLYIAIFMVWAAPVVDYLLWYITAVIKAKRNGTFYARKTPLLLKLAVTGGFAGMFLVIVKLYNFWFYIVIFSAFVPALLIDKLIKKVVGTEKGNGKEWEIYSGLMIAGVIIVWVWVALAGLKDAGISINVRESRAIRTENWESIPGHKYEKHVFNDDIPLRIEDMAAVDSEEYSYEGETYARNPAIKMYYGAQEADSRTNQPNMYYYIYDTKTDHIYDTVVQQHLKMYSSTLTEYDTLSADKVFVKTENGKYAMYLLCYPDRIIALDIQLELTEQQLKTAEEKLLDFEI